MMTVMIITSRPPCTDGLSSKSFFAILVIMLTNFEDFLKCTTFQTKKMAAARSGVTVNLPQLKIC